MRLYKNFNDLSKRIFKYFLTIISIPFMCIVVDILQFILWEDLNISLHNLLFGEILVNIILFTIILKVGFKYFNGKDYLDKFLVIIFGIQAYIFLIVQLSIIFFLYYISIESQTLIPSNILNNFFISLQDGGINLESIFAIILNYVTPNFFKYPTATGLTVVAQFFIGKFIDLLILAFIVDKLKRNIVS